MLPGLAVARELRRRGHGVVFVGTARGVETRLVPGAGFELRLLEIGPLKQVTLMRRLQTALELPRSCLEAAALLEKIAPAAVFSLGGYAAGPVDMMAKAKNIPLVVMEPNAVPGFVHRVMGPSVTRALVGFPEAGRYFPEGRWEVTGVPIREEFFTLPPRTPGEPFTVLITGGSQGSRRLNAAAVESLPLWRTSGLLDRVKFLHQTGQNEYNDICSRYREAGAPAEVAAFWDDMPGVMSRADLVVCRSGASAVAELAAAGRASILAPFPFAADQHQLRNAESMRSAGAARLVEDRGLSGQLLYKEIRELMERPEELAEMKRRAKQLARPGAANRAADVLEEVALLTSDS